MRMLTDRTSAQMYSMTAAMKTGAVAPTLVVPPPCLGVRMNLPILPMGKVQPALIDWETWALFLGAFFPLRDFLPAIVMSLVFRICVVSCFYLN